MPEVTDTFRLFNICFTINYQYMKKREKYYPVNKQEDEDGYTTYPCTAIITKIAKVRQRISSRNTIENAGLGSAQLQFRSLSLRFR
jgi:hypothetical protein